MIRSCGILSGVEVGRGYLISGCFFGRSFSAEGKGKDGGSVRGLEPEDREDRDLDLRVLRYRRLVH